MYIEHVLRSKEAYIKFQEEVHLAQNERNINRFGPCERKSDRLEMSDYCGHYYSSGVKAYQVAR